MSPLASRVNSRPVSPDSDAAAILEIVAPHTLEFTPVVTDGPPHKIARAAVAEATRSSAPSDDAILSRAGTILDAETHVDNLAGLLGLQPAQGVAEPSLHPANGSSQSLSELSTPRDIRDRRRSLSDVDGRARRGAQTSAEISVDAGRAVDDWKEHMRYYHERRDIVERIPRLIVLFCLVFCLAIQPLYDATNMLLSLDVLPRMLVLFSVCLVLAWVLWLQPLFSWFSWDYRGLLASACAPRIAPLEPSADALQQQQQDRRSAQSSGGPMPKQTPRHTKGVMPLPSDLEAQACVCEVVAADLYRFDASAEGSSSATG